MIEYTKNGILVDGACAISLEEVTRKVIQKRITECDYVLLKIEWGFRRGFDGVIEYIVVNNAAAKIVKQVLVGKHCYFGEIAGKHSSVGGIVEDKHVTINNDVEDVLNFILKNPTQHDYNHSFLWAIYDDMESDHYQKDILHQVLYS